MGGSRCVTHLQVLFRLPIAPNNINALHFTPVSPPLSHLPPLQNSHIQNSVYNLTKCSFSPCSPGNKGC